MDLDGGDDTEDTQESCSSYQGKDAMVALWQPVNERRRVEMKFSIDKRQRDEQERFDDMGRAVAMTPPGANGIGISAQKNGVQRLEAGTLGCGLHQETDERN